jgi:hypothetical protein
VGGEQCGGSAPSAHNTRAHANTRTVERRRDQLRQPAAGRLDQEEQIHGARLRQRRVVAAVAAAAAAAGGRQCVNHLRRAVLLRRLPLRLDRRRVVAAELELAGAAGPGAHGGLIEEQPDAGAGGAGAGRVRRGGAKVGTHRPHDD